MTQIDPISLAKFRVLVAIAKADGEFSREEEEALLGALGPHADVLPQLLAEDIDVDVAITSLSDADRKQVYQSAFALAYADGHAQTFEVAILKKLVPNKGEATMLGQVWGEALDTVLPSRILPEPDPSQRSSEILEDTFKYATLAAVAGATPVPGVAIVADIAVVALQAKLVHDIGLYWGHDLDQRAIRAFLGAAMGSVGLRIAVNNLARFVPVWGSAFAAGTSFATTFAIGKAADAWFANGRAMKDAELHEVFKAAQSSGHAEYVQHKADVDAARETYQADLEALNLALASGEIDRADYDLRVAELGEA